MEVAPAEPSDGASGGDPKAAPLHGLGARRLVGLSSAVSIPGFALTPAAAAPPHTRLPGPHGNAVNLLLMSRWALS